MKNKVLVIGRTDTIGGFGTHLFDENPTCDCCFSKLNLEKSKVKKLIEFLVTSDEECKDVAITEIVINNSFIGKELNFGENNIYTFKKKHLLVTEPINVISTIANTKDEEVTKQMCKIFGVDYEEYKKFSDMMDKSLEPMSKENLEKLLTEDNTDGVEPDLYISPVTLDNNNEYNIIDNDVFKQPFLNILKDMHLTNGNDKDDLIIIKNTIIDIRTIAKLIFKTTDSKSISVIWFGDHYYISINNSYKSLTKQEKSRMNHVLHNYHGLDLYIINK